MSKINKIQQAIKELEGGGFQKLFDAYLFKKYNFSNLQTLGVQVGTNKPTKGIPDSYVVLENGNYILIMYGSWQSNSYQKIKDDISSCFNKSKLKLADSKIQKIICGHSSTNIKIDDIEELKTLFSGVDIELIGIDTLSHDLLLNYQMLAKTYLNIEVDTGQILSVDDFIDSYDKNKTSAPLKMDFLFRDEEQEKIYQSINNNPVLIVTGPSGVGKTRLVLEVCRRFEREGWQILCIKNNGAHLYTDLGYYLSDADNCILFIDDANQTINLEFILDYIINKDKNIRVIMTVRDYAKSRVRQVVNSFFLANELGISPLKNEQIKDILELNFNIKNEHYINAIIRIAKGNPRLAVLAAKVSLEDGYVALQNAVNIFSHYYGNIIEKLEISHSQLIVLFVVSLIGPIKFTDNPYVIEILNIFNIKIDDFVEICLELHAKELVDIFEDNIVKISDQSLSNFIVEYFLYEKKHIKLSKLLDVTFPKFRNKIIYNLKMMLELFYSDDLHNYLSYEINESWESASNDVQNDYLHCFYYFNLEKTLTLIYERITGEYECNLDISQLDFYSKKNYQSITNSNIELLSGLKYSEFYKEAIELLMLYFKKRPDLFMEFYFALTVNFGFDKNSSKYNFKREYEMLEYLWECTKNGSEVNESLLFVHVSAEFLKCSVHRTEPGESNRTFNLVTINFKLDDGLKDIRKFIYEKLGYLYLQGIYTKEIDKILLSYHWDGISDDDSKEFFEYDIEQIECHIFNRIKALSFKQCYILYKLSKISKAFGLTKTSLCNHFANNKEFIIYETLSRNHFKGSSYEEDNVRKKEEITKLIEKYNLNDYDKLFELCKNIAAEVENTWELENSLMILFEIKEVNHAEYLEILDLYLKNGAPLCNNPYRIIRFLFKCLSVKDIKELVEKYDFQSKSKWLSILWEIIPEEKIDINVTSLFEDYIKNECTNIIPSFPEMITFEKFNKLDNEIIVLVSEKLKSCTKDNAWVLRNFFGHGMTCKETEKIISIYSDNLEQLEELYILALDEHFDYKGLLLIKIIEKDKSFWEKYTDVISNLENKVKYDMSVFETIWIQEDYNYFIDVLFKKKVEDNPFYSISMDAKYIFASRNDTKNIEDKKINWIKNYIEKNNEDVSKMKRIFGVIDCVFRKHKMDFILLYLNFNSNCDDFIQIYLFHGYNSWSGSEIPLIDEKINFLLALEQEIKGVKFLKHKFYLKEEIKKLQEYKKKVKMQEYIENEDII